MCFPYLLLVPSGLSLFCFLAEEDEEEEGLAEADAFSLFLLFPAGAESVFSDLACSAALGE